MRLLPPTLAVVLALVCATAARPDVLTESLDALVAKLGSLKYAEREAATSALDKHGAVALPALRAALKSGDPEVRRRASLLVDRIEYRVESARLLAGTKLRLSFKNTPVLEAVKQFAAKAGFPLEVQGDRLDLLDRTITLDTGETTFWEALDLFCRQAGLRERPVELPNINDIMMSRALSYVEKAGPEKTDRITLIDAKTVAMPTAYHGGVRLRAVPQTGLSKHASPLAPSLPVQKPQAVGFHLEVMPEPKMAWQKILSLQLTHVLDDMGQNLAQAPPQMVEEFIDPLFGFIPPAGGAIAFVELDEFILDRWSMERHKLVRLTPGKQPAQMLKEVRGKVTAEMETTQTLLTVDDVLGSVGKEFMCKDGGEIRVLEAARQGRNLSVKVGVSYIFGTKFPQAFSMTGADNKPVMATGFQPFDVVIAGNGKWGAQFKLQFELPDAKPAPGVFAYHGRRKITVEVPFVLRDVPLCDDPKLPMSESPYRVLTK